MKRNVLVLLLAVPWCTTVEAQKAVILVRHAERVDDSDDAALSEKGRARARALAEHLRSAGVKAIYTTQYQRTAKTAEPLARALSLVPVVVPSKESATLVERIKSQNANDIVLVVGHSNSVPEIIHLLGYNEPIVIPNEEYDNLFVLAPTPGNARLIRLRY